ncbi:zinc finger Y-chromosomal protein 2-like [Choristoneura fumiferana]|uniref:zinc finger Y-chromosomal protein 2-like n=1 Tax=Choristoneura fumiferana TaxID=7141 RepID=UPI003D15D722
MGTIRVKSTDAKAEKINNMRVQFKKQKVEKEAKKMEAKPKRISNLTKVSVYKFDSHKNQESKEPQDIQEEDSFDDTEDFYDIKGKTIDPLTEDIESEVVIEPRAAEFEENKDPKINNLEKEKADVKSNLLFEIDGGMGRIRVKSTDAKAEKLNKMRVQFMKQKAKKEAEKEAKKMQTKAKRISNLLRYVTGKKRNAAPLTKWQLQLRRAENNFLPNFDYAEFENKHDCKLKILTMEEQLEEIEERKQSSNYLNLDFKCEFCGRGFEFERSFKNHMAKHDPGIGKFECDVCHIRFRTQYLRHRHLDYHKMKFVCNICAFVTRAKHLARNHYLMHTGKVFKCKQCDATFTKSTSYFGHVRLNHPSRDAVCELCGDSFVGPVGLRHHKAKAHRELSKRKHECGSCGVKFASLDAMKKHADGRRKCDNSMKACAECGEVFSSGELLKEHADERHVLVQYWCEECSQPFVSQASLETHHQRVHLHIKWPAYGRTREMNREYYKKIKERTRLKAQVVCEMCGARLMSNAALERHQQSQCRRERSPKAYKCPHCVKSCATRQGLQLHITLHTGEKPYKCAQCPLEFRQSGALKRHHNKVHLGIDTRVQCEYCGKYFSTPSTKKLHVNTVHLKMPQPPRRRRSKGGDD